MIEKLYKKQSNVVYVVFASGWECGSTAILKNLFYDKNDADTYAEELRNEIYPNWNLSCTNKVYYSVTVEERKIL